MLALLLRISSLGGLGLDMKIFGLRLFADTITLTPFVYLALQFNLHTHNLL